MKGKKRGTRLLATLLAALLIFSDQSIVSLAATSSVSMGDAVIEEQEEEPFEENDAESLEELIET